MCSAIGERAVGTHVKQAEGPYAQRLQQLQRRHSPLNRVHVQRGRRPGRQRGRAAASRSPWQWRRRRSKRAWGHTREGCVSKRLRKVVGRSTLSSSGSRRGGRCGGGREASSVIVEECRGGATEFSGAHRGASGCGERRRRLQMCEREAGDDAGSQCQCAPATKSRTAQRPVAGEKEQRGRCCMRTGAGRREGARGARGGWRWASAHF
jgi:hypothetical protein